MGDRNKNSTFLEASKKNDIAEDIMGLESKLGNLQYLLLTLGNRPEEVELSKDEIKVRIMKAETQKKCLTTKNEILKSHLDPMLSDHKINILKVQDQLDTVENERKPLESKYEVLDIENQEMRKKYEEASKENNVITKSHQNSERKSCLLRDNLKSVQQVQNEKNKRISEAELHLKNTES